MTTTANWYHCSVKPISRSANRSAVAAAAYRIGEKLHDERTDITHDYTRKTGIEDYFIIAPAHAPQWSYEPEQLWNEAEKTEKRINSQTAREIELALPNEVSPETRKQIASDLGNHLVERYGVAVMVALHEPSQQGDDRNYHTHIMMTTRRMEAEGLGKKTRELDDKKTGGAEILHIREYAADLINTALEQAGSDERIDHRSFKDRGIEQIPTKHLSLEAIAMEKRGERSDQGDRNRERQQINQTINALAQERDELDRQIAEARSEPPEPTISPAPLQQTTASYWQDKIKAEREVGNDSGGSTASPITTEASRDSKNAITDPVNVAHAQQIAVHGEVQHKWLVKEWVEHAAEWVHELYHDFIYAITEEDEPDIPNSPSALDRLDNPEPQKPSGGAWGKIISEDRTPSNNPDHNNDIER